MSNMELNKNRIEIIKEFASDYHKKVYGRNIAKKLKMNQKTISNSLNDLEEQGILKFSTEGRNKYYFFNENYIHIKEIIKIIEIFRKIEFLERNKKIRDLFEKIESKVNGIVVIFGSYANDTNRKDSDLDIFILGKISNLEELEELYKIKINVVKSTKEKWNKKEIIIKEIIKNHIILKGMEEFIELIW